MGVSDGEKLYTCEANTLTELAALAYPVLRALTVRLRSHIGNEMTSISRRDGAASLRIDADGYASQGQAGSLLTHLTGNDGHTGAVGRQHLQHAGIEYLTGLKCHGEAQCRVAAQSGLELVGACGESALFDSAPAIAEAMHGAGGECDEGNARQRGAIAGVDKPSAQPGQGRDRARAERTGQGAAMPRP